MKFTTAALAMQCQSVDVLRKVYYEMHGSTLCSSVQFGMQGMMNENGFAIYANLMLTMYYSRPPNWQCMCVRQRGRVVSENENAAYA